MIINLTEGDTIYSTRLIPAGMIQHWKFKNECRNYGGGFASGAAFKVVALGKEPGNMWVKVQTPGSSPPGYLKIAGGEFAHNFRR